MTFVSYRKVTVLRETLKFGKVNGEAQFILITEAQALEEYSFWLKETSNIRLNARSQTTMVGCYC